MNKILATTLAATVIGLSAPAAFAASDMAPAEPRPEAGDSMERESGSVGQFIDDATVTARVKTALARDELTKARNIEVETVRNVVTLTGEVDSRAEIERASVITTGIEGVLSVNNMLMVKQ
ncbi:BON domain-containing protein [Thauera sp. Sel9]|uniref:BON domain-containing protein n=1 Tax=Thauera sp. Sel9 TaxID=2974299 RepID=UPI0021E0FDAB|nr:BON domain-containing protein [Thauera sp. Sel9]MCV2216927.1 BON domain-containing protein [Thauera sp. Sel9]